MLKTIKETTYKGTRIIVGNEKRNIINGMIKTLKNHKFTEIQIPNIQYQETFLGKVGEENNNLMFNFTDMGNRNICLAPEYTAVIQKLATTTYKYERDVKLFYVLECFRGENPQAGRYRQFTQLGVEILNNSEDYTDYLIELSSLLLYGTSIYGFNVNRDVRRGLDYYKEGKGFEITHDKLGSSKQIVGGGSYYGGTGFAIGIDRILPLTT